MPITKSAKKALRQSTKKRRINQRSKITLKKALRIFNEKPTKGSLSKAYSEIDKAVKKNLMEKNKSKRIKSRFLKIFKTLSKTTKKPVAGSSKTRAKMKK